MDPSQPNVSVGLSELISGSYEHDSTSSSGPPSTTAPKLSVMVQPPPTPPSGAVHRNLPSHPSNAKKQSLIDLPHTDIIGPSEVIKKILTLPYTQGNDYFALHRLGNTLVLDSMAGGEEFETETPSPTIHKEDDVQRIGLRKNHSADIIASNVTTTEDNILDKLHHLEHLDIDAEASSSLPSSTSTPSTSTISNMYSSRLMSSFLPPPEYYLPQETANATQPFRQVLRWQLSDVTFATGSNMVVYSTPQHPSLTLGPVDTSKSQNHIRMTCLDYYLDNMMAAVPELALCLHSKGFLRGVSVCPTEKIPSLPPHLTEGNAAPPSASSESGQQKTTDALFDPQVVEFNALAILRFLQQTCSKENGTYILHRGETSGGKSPAGGGGDSIQVYDLEAMSALYQRKWKWLLAMVSHRFALRLGHHNAMATAVSKEMLADRQMSLLTTCYNLLLECRHMDQLAATEEGQDTLQTERDDGDDSSRDRTTGTIRAAVLEQMADIHLKKAQSSRKGMLAADCSDSTPSNNDHPPKLSKNQKKKLNKKKNSSSTVQTQQLSKGPTDVKQSTAASSPSSQQQQQQQQHLKALTQGMQVIPPSGPNIHSGPDGTMTQDEEVHMEAEPVNYVEKINLSIEMLHKAMNCVLEDIGQVSGTTKKKELSKSALDDPNSKAMSDHGKDMEGDSGRDRNSDNSDEEDTLPPIIIGNMMCSPVVLNKSEPTFNTSSLSFSSGGASSELSASYTIQLSLTMQFTGLLHKVLLACHALVVEKLDVIPDGGRRKPRSLSFSGGGGLSSTSTSGVRPSDGTSNTEVSNFSRVSECVELLLKSLLPHCLEWLKLTNALKLQRSRLESSFQQGNRNADSSRSSQRDEIPSPPHSSFSFSLESECEDDDIEDLWSMDRTMLADLPLLWDIVGTVCRSTSTAAALAKTEQEGEPILLTWREECENSVKSLVHVMFVINILASRRMGLNELETILKDVTLVDTDVSATPTSTPSSAIPFSMTQCKEVVQQIGNMSLFNGVHTIAHHRKSVLNNEKERVTVWSTLCGCKISNTSSSFEDEESNSECASVFTDVMYPLYGHFLSSIAMPPLADGGLTQQKPCKTDLKSKDLLTILKIQGFCFLMSTLLICRAQSNWSQDQWADSTLHTPSRASKSSQRNNSNKAKHTSNESTSTVDSHTMMLGGDVARSKLLSPFHTHQGKYFLSLSSVNASNQKVILFVRHLADACNELGQAIASRLEDITSSVQQSNDISITYQLERVFDQFQKNLLDPSNLAEMYYKSAIGLFNCISPSSDEIRNVIAAECNCSSLKRLLAIRSSEMIIDAMKPFLQSSPSLNTILKAEQEEGEESKQNISQLQTLSILTRLLLGKKGNYFEFSLLSSSPNKKKKNRSMTSCTLYGQNDTLFSYQYEPLDFIHEGLGTCKLMQKKIEDLLGVSSVSAISDDDLSLPSHSLTQQDPSMKMVANEMARHYFLKGMLFKQCVQYLAPTANIALGECTASSGADSNSLHDQGKTLLAIVKTRDECLQFAMEYFQHAKSIFESLQMIRQKESSNYQLGSLAVALWRRYMEEYAQLSEHATNGPPRQPTYSLLGVSGSVKGMVEKVQEAAMDTLDKAMTCYSTAHEYYLKYDVNPTLVRILIDMCDIYMTSYLDCEPAIISEMNCVRELIESGVKSSQSMKDSLATNLLPQCTNESITSLLGGALKVLMDCRFAMTDAVVGKYPHEMALLAVQVAAHLQQLLLKLLRILKLLPTVDSMDSGKSSLDGSALSEGENDREQCVRVIKLQYSQLLTLTTHGGDADKDSSKLGQGRPQQDNKGGSADICQILYVILEKLNSIVFLKELLLIS